MRSPLGFSVASLMAFVALAAVSLAAFRVHLSLGSFVSVLVILSGYRYFGIARTRQRIGYPLRRRELVLTFLESFLVSLVILGCATMIALTIFLFGNAIESGGRSPLPYHSPISLFLALFAAWYIARRGRLELWPSRRCNIPSSASPQSPEIVWLPGLEFQNPTVGVNETPSTFSE